MVKRTAIRVPIAFMMDGHFTSYRLRKSAVSINIAPTRKTNNNSTACTGEIHITVCRCRQHPLLLSSVKSPTKFSLTFFQDSEFGSMHVSNTNFCGPLSADDVGQVRTAAGLVLFYSPILLSSAGNGGRAMTARETRACRFRRHRCTMTFAMRK